MKEDVVVRPAGPRDAKNCAPLIFDSGPVLFAYMLGAEPDRLLQIIREVFIRPNHAFSYQNAYVAVEQGGVAGCILGFPGRRELTLDLGVVRVFPCVLTWREMAHGVRRTPDLLSLESAVERSSHYVQNLAVAEERRDHGIGTHMLQWAEQHARELGCDSLSIDVLVENPRALALYERFGFELRHTALARKRLRRWTGITGSHHMVKPLM